VPRLKPRRLRTEDAGRFAALESFVRLVGPSTVLTALLYYFGWARTHAVYLYFGIDADALGFSPVDYFLRSADTLWTPLVAAAGIVLFAGTVRRFLSQLITAHLAGRPRAALLAVLVTLAASLLAVAVLRVLGRVLFGYPLLAPLCLLGGIALLAAAYRTVWPGEKGPRQVFWVLVVLSCFWATAEFAGELGQGRAAHLEAQQFATVPDVIVYSRNRLDLDPQGVSEKVLSAGYAPYRYRYDGWKMLTRTDKEMVLIPYNWSTSNAYALVLPVGADEFVEFTPHFS
jgi:hypothetical protein